MEHGTLDCTLDQRNICYKLFHLHPPCVGGRAGKSSGRQARWGHPVALCVCVMGRPELWEGQGAETASLLWLALRPCVCSPFLAPAFSLALPQGARRLSCPCLWPPQPTRLTPSSSSAEPSRSATCSRPDWSHLVAFPPLSAWEIPEPRCARPGTPVRPFRQAPGLPAEGKKQHLYRYQLLSHFEPFLPTEGLGPPPGPDEQLPHFTGKKTQARGPSPRPLSEQERQHLARRTLDVSQETGESASAPCQLCDLTQSLAFSELPFPGPCCDDISCLTGFFCFFF